MSWTPDRIEKLKAMYRAGVPTARIAEKIGVSQCAVIGKAKRLGLVHPGRGTGGFGPNLGRAKRMAALYVAGVCVDAIADEYETGRGEVHRAIKKYTNGHILRHQVRSGRGDLFDRIMAEVVATLDVSPQKTDSPTPRSDCTTSLGSGIN